MQASAGAFSRVDPVETGVGVTDDGWGFFSIGTNLQDIQKIVGPLVSGKGGLLLEVGHRSPLRTLLSQLGERLNEERVLARGGNHGVSGAVRAQLRRQPVVDRHSGESRPRFDGHHAHLSIEVHHRQGVRRHRVANELPVLARVVGLVAALLVGGPPVGRRRVRDFEARDLEAGRSRGDPGPLFVIDDEMPAESDTTRLQLRAHRPGEGAVFRRGGGIAGRVIVRDDDLGHAKTLGPPNDLINPRDRLLDVDEGDRA